MTAPASEVREFVAAIRDALAVPGADSRQPGAERAEEKLRAERTALVRGVLGNFLATGAPARDLEVTARTIRSASADTPVTYPVSRYAEVK